APSCRVAGARRPPHPRSCPTRRSSDLAAPSGPKLATTGVRKFVSGSPPQLPRHQSPEQMSYERPATPQRMDRGTVARRFRGHARSEEHTSELQSRENLVCRLLLEKKKN